MCGICGGLSWKAPLGAEALRRMTRTLTHRGPDDEGFFLAPPVALGVRRLAVIDLETGHQPVGNEDGSVQVVDGRGTIVACYQTPAGVRSIRACKLDGKPQTKGIVASCEDGSVWALQLAP